MYHIIIILAKQNCKLQATKGVRIHTYYLLIIHYFIQAEFQPYFHYLFWPLLGLFQNNENRVVGMYIFRTFLDERRLE